MSEMSPTSRRRFMTTTASAAAGLMIVPRHVLGGPHFVAPSDKVNVALIGAGGQGMQNARALLQEDDCQIIAVADPAEEWDLSAWYYGGTSGRGPARVLVEQHYAEKTPNHRCAVYEDFRVMLEKEASIDAVLIATPDHLHAYVSILAMKAGKHVYCEKPLTHNIREARLVARVAAETGVATQMGNQGRSGEGHRQTVEWLADGAIGAVREVHAWSGAPQTSASAPAAEGPREKPAGFNWDLWLGPRAERPYSGAYTPYSWRYYWDFGNGTMADMSIHHLDPAFNALGLDAPLTVESSASRVDAETVTASQLVAYRFGAQAGRGPVTVYWYDHGLRPPTPVGMDPDDPRQRLGEGDNGLLVVGEKGVLTCAGWSGMPRLLPLDLHFAYKRPPRSLPRVAGHHADWLQACKGGTPACSRFEYGARLTEFVLLGPLALRTGKMLKWDAPGMRATNAPEAQPMIEGTYRKGWELPV
ncbi:MAG: putative dehydrogenase [Acidobacteria bacterium]|nr:putative dehydrogenase [Acidobacteriota bacterium]